MPVLTKINTNSIAEDAITGDKFAGDAYLANTANQNISGTYSENRLYTSDAYTLSANATVNSHLTLSSIKPTGDVVLTAGGAYTITGTGVLSGGSLLAKTPSLTGMTGELGSTVTGSPNLNLTTGTLGSDVTFPAGQVLQTVLAKNGTEAASTGFNLVTAVAGSISLSNASNKIVVWSSTPCVYQTYGGSSNTSGSVYGGFQHVSSGTGVSAETKVWGSWYSGQGLYGFGWSSGSTDEKFLKTIATFVWTFTPGTTNTTAITLQAAGYGDHTMTVNYQGGSSPYHKESLMVLQEIQV